MADEIMAPIEVRISIKVGGDVFAPPLWRIVSTTEGDSWKDELRTLAASQVERAIVEIERKSPWPAAENLLVRDGDGWKPYRD